MARIEERVVIAVPPEEVFDYRLDFASNLTTYNTNVRDVEQIEGNQLGVGAKYRVRVHVAPGFSVTSTITVTDAARPERIADSARSRTGNADEIVSFEPVDQIINLHAQAFAPAHLDEWPCAILRTQLITQLLARSRREPKSASS